MALDTRDKRASAVNVSMPWRGLLPEPGTITGADSYQLAFMYRGISAGAPVEPDPSERVTNGQMLHMSKWMCR
jgi:hypothetical protein